MPIIVAALGTGLDLAGIRLVMQSDAGGEFSSVMPLRLYWRDRKPAVYQTIRMSFTALDFVIERDEKESQLT